MNTPEALTPRPGNSVYSRKYAGVKDGVNGLMVVVVLQFCMFINASLVFEVQHKFTGKNISMADYANHDYYRHMKISSVADLPIGSSPFTGFYFTMIQIGTPPRYYYVEVDIGSDLMWVNCARCQSCASSGDRDVSFPMYDPKLSSSSKMITCDQDFCTYTRASYMSDCYMEMECPYFVKYNDGSSTSGYLVRDEVKFNGVSGDLHAINMTGSVNFGCGTQQLSLDVSPSHVRLGGVLGLGPSNSSVISQLASAKTVKRRFSHCLREQPNGGIFAIGEVVHPKVSTTPVMMPIRPSFISHYIIEMKAIEVGHEFINVSTNVTNNNINSASNGKAIIDIGTRFSYFPYETYTKLVDQVFANNTLAKESCFSAAHHEEIFDAMPIITFHFSNNLKLKVYPRQYIVPGDNCIVFRSSTLLPEGNDHVILLGATLLTDNLVTYNMEDETIGWTEYNCSSSIKVKDEQTNRVYDVSSHDLYTKPVLSTNQGAVIPSRMFLYFFVFACILLLLVFILSLTM